MHSQRSDGLAGTHAVSGWNDDAAIGAGARRKHNKAIENTTGIMTITSRLRPRRVLCFLAPRGMLLHLRPTGILRDHPGIKRSPGAMPGLDAFLPSVRLYPSYQAWAAFLCALPGFLAEALCVLFFAVALALVCLTGACFAEDLFAVAFFDEDL